MGEHTEISWADATYNPWWGCTRVSDECTHCYAETLAKRWGTGWGKNADRRFFGDKHWAEPLAWNRKAEREGKPLRVFCASMADVFEDRPELTPERERLWALIEATPWVVWLLLTKRPENIAPFTPLAWHTQERWPKNVWVGTTAGHQKSADERLPHLMAVPAPVRFVSVEPMLGPVDLSRWLPITAPGGIMAPLSPGYVSPLAGMPRLSPDLTVQWVICGGESGQGARPMHPEWARALRDQTLAAGVPFMFKQAGRVLAGQWGITGKGDSWDELPDEFKIREVPPIPNPSTTLL